MELEKHNMFLEQEKHEKRMDLGRELLDQQVKFRKAMAANQQDQGLNETVTAKLTITKFDGAFANWLPFWNKFKTEIYATDLAPVTKFATKRASGAEGHGTRR